MIQRCLIICLMVIFQSCSSFSTKVDQDTRLPVLGWLEYARLQEAPQYYMKAKLDPGAKTSSLHATNIKRYRKGDKRFVRFTFEEVDQLSGERISIEFDRPLLRTVAIKRHGGKSISRPVVELEFYLGENLYQAEFSLTDRSRFHYPMLLGRRFLKDAALVDSGKTYLLGEPKVRGAH